MTGVILNSGGMDSFFVAQENPYLTHVFVDIGQSYVEKELASAKRIAEHFHAPFQYIRGAQIGGYEHSSGIIPLRNAELILCAGQFGDDIYLGILSNEVNSDKSPEFLRAMETVMDISCRAQYWSDGRTFRIHTPLGTRSKVDLLSNLFRNTGGAGHPDWDACMATVSCYSPSDKHCGVCPSCFKRWVALNVATGVDHGDEFLNHPAKWKPLAEWQSKGYAPTRIQEIEAAYEV